MFRQCERGLLIPMPRIFVGGWVLWLLLLVGRSAPESQSVAPLFPQGSRSSDRVKVIYQPDGRSARRHGDASSLGNSGQRNSEGDRALQLRSSALVLIKKARRPDLAMALRQLKESAALYQKAQFNIDAAADYLTIGEIYVTWGQNRKALTM